MSWDQRRGSGGAPGHTYDGNERGQAGPGAWCQVSAHTSAERGGGDSTRSWHQHYGDWEYVVTQTAPDQGHPVSRWTVNFVQEALSGLEVVQTGGEDGAGEASCTLSRLPLRLMHSGIFITFLSFAGF